MKYSLDQYKVVVDLLEKSVSTRQSINNFWCTIHSILMGLLGAYRSCLDTNTLPNLLTIHLITFLGFVLCFIWISTLKNILVEIQSRKNLLLEIEEQLSINIFKRLAPTEEKKTTFSITQKEMLIPYTFCFVHFIFYAAYSYFY